MKKTTNKAATAPRPVKLYESTGKKPAKSAKPVSAIGLANPVTEMAAKIEALFKCIPDTLTDFDYETGTVFVYTPANERSEAIRFFLRGVHEFGNLKLRVRMFLVDHGEIEEGNVPPAYTVTDEALVRMFRSLFKGGPIEPVYTQLVDQTGTPWNFFEFPTYGISFQADDLQNRSGRRAELVADLVKEVLDTRFFKISSMG
jgi:hypothetical protein